MRIKVEMEVDAKPGMTDQEIAEWVEFNVGARGGLSGDNPMVDEDLSAVSGSVRTRG